jgi:PAS domain-containing protein
MILAYLLLLTGLTISAVAIYYSVVGLTAIFSAAAIPIIIMGSALEVGKLVCASWLKANWERAPRFMKYYMVIAVVVLMLITSMGIFGFLSKAHNDQTLVSGDVSSKIAVFDEKIKTERENIDANRKILKQLDESVDQVMGRSQDEKGAEKAVAIRKAQQKERGRIAQDITESQKKITALNEERAPIAAEVRKVEAEVGPIKYIAAFIYGTAPDESMLERAVTWIIILIVVVFDPLAVIMLLAAQMTFGWRNESSNEGKLIQDRDGTIIGVVPTYVADVGEPPTVEELEEIHTEEVPSETLPTALGGDITASEEPEVSHTTESELEKWNKMIEEAEKEVLAQTTTVEQRVAKGETYIDNEGKEITLEVDLPVDESKKKTYMIKDDQGQIQVKDR